MNLEKIGYRLKQVRKTLGFTLDKMSELTGSSVSGISEMESGNKKPSSVYMFGLAKEFKININWILTGCGTMFTPDVELKLKFGDDNELIRELIFYLKNVNIARFEILSHFLKFKKDNADMLDDIKVNNGES